MDAALTYHFNYIEQEKSFKIINFSSNIIKTIQNIPAYPNQENPIETTARPAIIIEDLQDEVEKRCGKLISGRMTLLSY